MTAEESLERLKDGNRAYQNGGGWGDCSAEVRRDTAANGQHPFAVVVSCSDSRVIPEAIFSCGIGDLFTIRVAGNVVGMQQLGSIEYAAESLGCPLVVILGHTDCGAVAAALSGQARGYVQSITDEILRAVGDTKDANTASRLNVEHVVGQVRAAFRAHKNLSGLRVVGAGYDMETGCVTFFPDVCRR